MKVIVSLMSTLIGYSLKKEIDSTLNPHLIMVWKKNDWFEIRPRITRDLWLQWPELKKYWWSVVNSFLKKGWGFQAVKPDWILLIQIERGIQIYFCPWVDGCCIILSSYWCWVVGVPNILTDQECLKSYKIKISCEFCTIRWWKWTIWTQKWALFC